MSTFDEMAASWDQVGSSGDAELDAAFDLYESGAMAPEEIAAGFRDSGMFQHERAFLTKWAADEQAVAEPTSAADYLAAQQMRAEAVRQLAADAAAAKAETEAAAKAAEHAQMVSETVTDWFGKVPAGDQLAPVMAALAKAVPARPETPEAVREALAGQYAAAKELEQARRRAEAEWELGELAGSRDDGWLGNSESNQQAIRSSDGRQFNATTKSYESFDEVLARHIDPARAKVAATVSQQADAALDAAVNDPMRAQFTADVERAVWHGVEGSSGKRPETIDGKNLDLPKPPARMFEADADDEVSFDPDGRRATLDREWKV